MPRFDPPHYLIESDGLRMREAPRQAVHGHYLGALGAAPLSMREALPVFNRLSSAEKRDAIKKNKDQILAAYRKQGITNIVVNNDGTLRFVDFVAQLDSMFRGMINSSVPSVVFDEKTKTFKPGASKPLSALIDGMPVVTAEQKRAFKNAPVTTLLNIFNPLLGLLTDPKDGVLPRVMQQQGSIYDLSTFPFNVKGATRVDISLVQPLDELFDQASRDNLLRVRALQAFIVLFFRKWVELHAELGRKGLEVVGTVAASLFQKEDVALTSTRAGMTNDFENPNVVDMIPGVSSSSPPVREGKNKKGQTVYVAGKTYYALSPKGLYQQAVFLREEWDRKYEAYKNDKITNAVGVVLYGPRMTFLRSQGKTEGQARDIIAREDNFPRQFAETPHLPMQFRVVGSPALGGGIAPARNGPKPELPAQVSGLGNYELGATGAEEVVAILGALESFAAVVGPYVVAIAIGAMTLTGIALIGTVAIVLATMGQTVGFGFDLSKGSASIQTEAGADGSAPSKAGGEGTAGTQSAGGGISPVLVLAAVGLGILALRKANA